jgi:hypothetical protein
MNKIDLALEVLRMNTGGDVRTEAYKVVREALNPPTVAEAPEAAKRRYAEETLKRLEKERKYDERYHYLHQEISGAANANDRTREWLREVDENQKWQRGSIVVLLIWVLVLTILFIVKM